MKKNGIQIATPVLCAVLLVAILWQKQVVDAIDGSFWSDDGTEKTGAAGQGVAAADAGTVAGGTGTGGLVGFR